MSRYYVQVLWLMEKGLLLRMAEEGHCWSTGEKTKVVRQTNMAAHLWRRRAALHRHTQPCGSDRRYGAPGFLLELDYRAFKDSQYYAHA